MSKYRLTLNYRQHIQEELERLVIALEKCEENDLVLKVEQLRRLLEEYSLKH